VTINALGIDYKNIQLDKQVFIGGFDGLKNSTSIKNLDFSHSTEKEIILSLEANILNPSIVELDSIGNLSLDVQYKGIYIPFDIFS
jgi:hypothetical protein